MNQRRQTPTGTFERQRLVTGEHTVVGKHPPTPPALQPIHAALETMSTRLGEQVANQREFRDQVSAVIATVQQSDMLHRQSTQCLRQVYDQVVDVTGLLTDLTAAIQRNSRLRQRAEGSWITRALYTIYRNYVPALVGVVAFGVCFAAFGVVVYLTR
jgi:hypothetical protein